MGSWQFLCQSVCTAVHSPCTYLPLCVSLCVPRYTVPVLTCRYVSVCVYRGTQSMYLRPPMCQSVCKVVRVLNEKGTEVRHSRMCSARAQCVESCVSELGRDTCVECWNPVCREQRESTCNNNIDYLIYMYWILQKIPYAYDKYYFVYKLVNSI